jgi:hypothetical protein
MVPPKDLRKRRVGWLFYPVQCKRGATVALLLRTPLTHHRIKGCSDYLNFYFDKRSASILQNARFHKSKIDNDG